MDVGVNEDCPAWTWPILGGLRTCEGVERLLRTSYKNMLFTCGDTSRPESFPRRRPLRGAPQKLMSGALTPVLLWECVGVRRLRLRGTLRVLSHRVICAPEQFRPPDARTCLFRCTRRMCTCERPGATSDICTPAPDHLLRCYCSPPNLLPATFCKHPLMISMYRISALHVCILLSSPTCRKPSSLVVGGTRTRHHTPTPAAFGIVLLLRAVFVGPRRSSASRGRT